MTVGGYPNHAIFTREYYAQSPDITDEMADHYVELGKICRKLSRASVKWLKDLNETYCLPYFDGFVCWPAAEAGTTSIQPCPELIVSDTSKNITRSCGNGTWDITDFTVCLSNKKPEEHIKDEKESMAVTITFLVGYSLSIISLLLAIIIFTKIRSLKCLRNTIHTNFCLAMLLKCVMFIILTILTRIKNWKYGLKTVCKTSRILLHFFHSTTITWMFVEGLYIFVVINLSYSATSLKLRDFLLIGWGVSFMTTSVWLVTRMVNDTIYPENIHDECFTFDLKIDEILGYFHLALIAVNMIFVIGVVWVLLIKLRASNTLEVRQYRMAAKATIVLSPLLGVNYLLFVDAELFFLDESIFALRMINTVLQSSQGLLVAIFYSFLNKEVQSALLHKYNTWQDSRTVGTYSKSSFSSKRQSTIAKDKSSQNAPGVDTHDAAIVSTFASRKSRDASTVSITASRKSHLSTPEHLNTSKTTPLVASAEISATSQDFGANLLHRVKSTSV